jgi:hypothetical protein
MRGFSFARDFLTFAKNAKAKPNKVLSRVITPDEPWMSAAQPGALPGTGGWLQAGRIRQTVTTKDT